MTITPSSSPRSTDGLHASGRLRPAGPGRCAREPRVLLAALTALALAGCGTTVPPTPPTAASIAASPSASPDIAFPIDDAAYLTGDAFPLPIVEAGADWIAPTPLPIMRNGQAAQRVAFLPASCAGLNVSILTDAAPEDAWETQLRQDGEQRNYSIGSWPAAQVPECADGQGRTYLEVAYHPLGPAAIIHLVATVTRFEAPPSVTVVPVFTSADASQPAFGANGSEALGPLPGAKKARGAKPQLLMAGPFIRVTLPDGSTPTTWGLQVTGCGPVGGTELIITARVGEAAPIDVGTCSEGSFMSSRMALPLPPEGTTVTILMSGGTTKSQVRISEFQWRGERS